MKHLLDVNLLLAVIWTTHTHHKRAQAWLQDKEIVLCPVTELGFIRVSTNKRAIDAPMDRTRQLLAKFTADRKADMIPDDLPALASHPRTAEQVTDHYLADLASKRGFKLATFDEHIKHPSAELVS